MKPRPLPVVLVLGAATACGFLRDSPRLEEFLFEEGNHGQTVEASIDASGFAAGEIIFGGQLNTPHACYTLRGTLDRSGSRLTIRVSAQQNRPDCGSEIGSYRYQGAVRNLRSGTYQLRVQHMFDAADWPPQEFSIPVNVP